MPPLRVFYGALPCISVVVVWLALWLAPRASYRILFTEQGVVELGTAFLFAVAAVSAVGLSRRSGHSSADRFRPFFALVAVGASFVALEEVSWGQHLFGWRSPDWFLTWNRQHETNVHNLLGNRVSEWFRTAAYVGSLLVAVALPLAVRRRPRSYEPSDWTFYLVPGRELVILAILSLTATLPNKLPGTPRVGGHLRELTEFYQAWAAVMYLAVLTYRRRELFTRPAVLREPRASAIQG